MSQRDREVTYGSLCRRFLKRISSRDGISWVALAEEAGVPLTETTSELDRDAIEFRKAIDLAKRAKATVSELADLERTWFLERMPEELHLPFTRMQRLMHAYGDTIYELEGFLKQHGLLEGFLKIWRKTKALRASNDLDEMRRTHGRHRKPGGTPRRRGPHGIPERRARRRQ